jgi:ectoine hydroxylase-related dioxygenase (phytanoyl-CoA dioxygenase family)
VATLAEQLREQGYAIVRGVFSGDEMSEIQREVDSVEREALQHHASYRDHNLYYEIAHDPKLARRVVLQAHWFSWTNKRLESLRRDPRVLSLLEPLLGNSIKQIANQIHWKPPGGKLTSYRFHQDIRFREDPRAFSDIEGGCLNMGLAIDAQTHENGALRIIPGSHRNGYLGLSDDGPIMTGTNSEEELRAAGLDPDSVVVCDLEPGDIVVWTLMTVHGSAANTSTRDRCFNINSYARADSTTRGEWTFNNGESTPLGDKPQLCKYEDLYRNPGPYYVEEEWWAAEP